MIKVEGTVATFPQGPTRALTLRPAAVTASVTILPSNLLRLGCSVFNEGPADLYINLGQTASLTAYVVILPSRTLYEVPFNFLGPIVAFASVSTQPMVTEFIL